jgi:hypothetical protein
MLAYLLLNEPPRKVETNHRAIALNPADESDYSASPMRVKAAQLSGSGYFCFVVNIA